MATRSKKAPVIIDPSNLTTPPRLMLAVDPGIANGWAEFADGILVKWGTVKGVNEFDDWLHSKERPEYDQLVYEDYRLFRHKAVQQIGSRFETAQVIGMLNSWARQNNINFNPDTDRQPSSILPEGCLFSGWPMPTDHSKSHHVAAIAHGTYWLVKNGMIVPHA